MIIFMGVAGSGKSVQGKMLADKLALPWLSTGEFLRMLVAGDRRKDMVSGKLLSDKEIITLVQRIFSLVDTNNEFILDGFPRTTAQADWLIGQVKHGQLHATAVVNLEVSPKTVNERLSKRGRPDDSVDAIKERLAEYEESAKKIMEHFEKANVPIIKINGAQSINDVQKDILTAVNPLLPA